MEEGRCKSEINSENEVYLRNLQTPAFPSPISIDNGVVCVMIKKLKIVSHKSPWLVSGFPSLGLLNASSSQASCPFRLHEAPYRASPLSRSRAHTHIPCSCSIWGGGGIWRASQGSAAPAHCTTASISHLPSPDERLGTQNRLLGKYGLPQGPERSLEDWLFSIINGTTYHFKCIFVDLRKHHKGKKTNNKQTKPTLVF